MFTVPLLLAVPFDLAERLRIDVVRPAARPAAQATRTTGGKATDRAHVRGACVRSESVLHQAGDRPRHLACAGRHRHRSDGLVSRRTHARMARAR